MIDYRATSVTQTALNAAPITWRASDDLVSYEDALGFMEDRATAIRAGTAEEMVWLVEHPPVYTAGTSADPAELLNTRGLPVFQTGRGGRYTYHGPGQRVIYVMMDLKKRGSDIRCYVRDLERWVIETLATFTIHGETRDGRVGVWVDRGHGFEDKIAALGVRVRRWVTFHGIAINVEPDLTRFKSIIPCGVSKSNFGVTSFADLGHTATMEDVDCALMKTFEIVFGRKPVWERNQ